MAFQIVDDVLDLTASEDVLGKPVASDLREGKVTMSVIHALERCTPEERSKIETILQDRAFNGVTHAQIMEILRRYGSLTPRPRVPHGMRSRLKTRSALSLIPRSSALCYGRLISWSLGRSRQKARIAEAAETCRRVHRENLKVFHR